MKRNILFLLLFLPHIFLGQNKYLTQTDFIGNSHYSSFNFTDRDTSYHGIDSWGYLKQTFWLSDGRKLGFYTGIEGSNMFFLNPDEKDEPLYWQKYLQTALGFQWHPFFNGSEEHPRTSPLSGLRLFAEGGYRWYYHQPEPTNTNPFSNYIRKDFRAGIDYYFDNLYPIFLPENMALFAWANASFRATNYASDQYNGLVVAVNVKPGYQWKIIQDSLTSTAVFYGLMDMSYSPRCFCRWWENYVRGGAGFSVYPFSYNKNRLQHDERITRIHFYVEYRHQLLWFGEGPKNTLFPLKNWDIQAGIGFSTPGFVRQKK